MQSVTSLDMNIIYLVLSFYDGLHLILTSKNFFNNRSAKHGAVIIHSDSTPVQCPRGMDPPT